MREDAGEDRGRILGVREDAGKILVGYSEGIGVRQDTGSKGGNWKGLGKMWEVPGRMGRSSWENTGREGGYWEDPGRLLGVRVLGRSWEDAGSVGGCWWETRGR